MKTVSFLGFGKSNRAVFEYLRAFSHLSFLIRDEGREISSPPKGVTLLLGEDCFSPRGEDIIFLSPSVRRERREVRALLDGGAVALSDAELFFLTEPESVIAISGSDGKSTTAALVGKMLELSGIKTEVCGNFGIPMTPLAEKRDTFFVAELSSFTLRYLKPRVLRAAITNITPNHLNWHESFEEYTEAKLGIYENANEAIINAEEPRVFGIKPFAAFSVEKSFKELSGQMRAEVYYTLEDGWIRRNGENYILREEVALFGLHNAKNALCALALTEEKADKDACKTALRTFRGLAHRMELVGEYCGQRFYDSSIDSTPERTRATLSSFSGRAAVILGGRDKGVPYGPLLSALDGKAAAIVLLGENADALFAFFKNAGLEIPIALARDMDEAVYLAKGFGVDVILSPAATSFDRYANFEARGQDFVRAVKERIKK